MSAPLTIIIPTHNRPLFAQRAIKSVMNQCVFNIPIILVNDGSDSIHDNEYYDAVKNYPGEINYIAYDHAKGVSTARNIGVSHAKTEWILFLDDDDELQGQYIEALLKNISDSSLVDLFWCDVLAQKKCEFSSDGIIEKREFCDTSSLDNLICQLLKIGVSYGVAMKRSVFNCLKGFDASFKVGEDTEFFIRLMSQGFVAKPIKYFGVLKHEEHDERLSFKYASYSEKNTYEDLLERHANFFSERKFSQLSMMLWSLYVHFSNGSYSKVEKRLPQLLELNNEIAARL